MTKSHLGLIESGSKIWIAGLNYTKSLIYANSLLPKDEKLDITLFVQQSSFNKSEYDDIRPYIKYLIVFSNIFPEEKIDISSKKSIIPDFKCLRGTDKSLSNKIRKTSCKIIFPSPFPGSIETFSQRMISWIPDFQHLRMPQFFSEAEKEERNRYFRMLLDHSDTVIVSNNFSLNDALTFFPYHRSKIKVLPFRVWLGKNAIYKDCENVKRKYHLPDKYFFFPCQFWIHKNHKFLFNVVSNTIKRSFKDILLVCTGNTVDYRHPQLEKELFDLIRDEKLENNIRILGLIPRSEQVQLMRGAAAIIQPSLFEGWSALVEEARALGKKIFLSDIPMHREQEPENCSFFNPYDPESLMEILMTEWPHLRSGPDKFTEKESMSKYNKYFVDFAFQFRNICLSTF